MEGDINYIRGRCLINKQPWRNDVALELQRPLPHLAGSWECVKLKAPDFGHWEGPRRAAVPAPALFPAYCKSFSCAPQTWLSFVSLLFLFLFFWGGVLFCFFKWQIQTD